MWKDVKTQKSGIALLIAEAKMPRLYLFELEENNLVVEDR
jgi:hypothetical protein